MHQEKILSWRFPSSFLSSGPLSQLFISIISIISIDSFVLGWLWLIKPPLFHINQSIIQLSHPRLTIVWAWLELSRHQSSPLLSPLLLILLVQTSSLMLVREMWLVLRTDGRGWIVKWAEWRDWWPNTDWYWRFLWETETLKIILKNYALPLPLSSALGDIKINNKLFKSQIVKYFAK